MREREGVNFLIPSPPQWAAWSLRRNYKFRPLLDCPFAAIMPSNKTFDVSRDGRVLELPIAAEDMTVSRLSQVFQASTDCDYIWILAKSPDDITATVQD